MSSAGPTIGFVGLGTMGAALARRLLEQEYQVIGYNRTRAKAEALEPAGLHLVDSPREAAARSDVCFSMVTDDPSLNAVARGDSGIIAGLRPRAIYVELSTVSPQLARRLANETSAVGATMLDAHVRQRRARPQRPARLDGWRPTEDARRGPAGPSGHRRKITWVGGPGDGKLMKLATNLQVSVQTLAFAESLRRRLANAPASRTVHARPAGEGVVHHRPRSRTCGLRWKSPTSWAQPCPQQARLPMPTRALLEPGEAREAAAIYDVVDELRPTTTVR